MLLLLLLLLLLDLWMLQVVGLVWTGCCCCHLLSCAGVCQTECTQCQFRGPTSRDTTAVGHSTGSGGAVCKPTLLERLLLPLLLVLLLLSSLLSLLVLLLLLPLALVTPTQVSCCADTRRDSKAMAKR